MNFKAPALAVDIKALRGVSAGDFASLRPNLNIIDTVIMLGTPIDVAAGTDTPFAMTVPGLPSNADLSRIVATLTVADGTPPADNPPSTVTVAEGNSKRTVNVTVASQAGLQNVELRLDGGQPFWSHPGLLKPGAYTIPDFSRQANEFLDSASTPGVSAALRFVIKSEVAGRIYLQISSRDFDYTQIQTKVWTNDLDQTARVDRNFVLGFGSVESMDLDLPGGVQRKKVSLEVGGQFGAERLLGPVSEWNPTEFASVSPDYSVAQKFQPRSDLGDIKLAGVALHYGSPAGAEIYVELQEDQGGYPGGGSARAQVKAAFQPNANAGWLAARFESPVTWTAGQAGWIVVKGIQGSGRVGLRTAPASDERAPVSIGDIFLNRGGVLWKGFARRASPRNADPSAALIALIYLPEPDTQTAAIRIELMPAGVDQNLDPVPQPQPISLDLSGHNDPAIRLRIYSSAEGQLTVANVIQQYRMR